jgi:hypothetical protein
MAGSDFHKPISETLCSTLGIQILISIERFMDLLGSITYLYKLANACDPGG